jgi:hypothetical protein
MDYVICILIGLMLGIFACVMIYALLVAFRPTPPTMHGRRKLVQWEPPEVAQMPVVEAGSIRYEFLGQTGEERA